MKNISYWKNQKENTNWLVLVYTMQSGMNKVFEKAIDSVKSKPAEFLVMIILIFFAGIVTPTLDGEYRLYLSLFVIGVISILLYKVIITGSNALNSESSISRAQTSESQKLNVLLDEILNSDYYHRLIEYQFVFKRIEGDSIIVNFSFKQVTYNNASFSIHKPVVFPFFDRESSEPQASVNDIPYSFEGRENARNNRGYQIDVTIPPKDEVKVSFNIDLRYSFEDSEICQVYRFTEVLECTLVDEISNGEEGFDILLHPMHNYRGTTGQLESDPANRNSKKIKIDKGLLPYQGIYIKWKKNG